MDIYVSRPILLSYIFFPQKIQTLVVLDHREEKILEIRYVTDWA